MSGLPTTPSSSEKPTVPVLLDALLSWVFGIVMLLAAMAHLENPYYFLGSVYAYKLVDPGLGQAVAMILPLLQLLI